MTPVVVVHGVAHQPRRRAMPPGTRGGPVFTRYAGRGELPYTWPAACTGERGIVYEYAWPVDQLPACPTCTQALEAAA